MQQSEIIHHKSGGITLAGPDAVNLYRAVMLKSGLAMYAKSKMLLTRVMTPSAMLAAATSTPARPTSAASTSRPQPTSTSGCRP